MAGANPISRLAGWPGNLPASQGYIGTGGPEFAPRPETAWAVPGPLIGVIQVEKIGVQWAPGQGGDTPGGGGAATAGTDLVSGPPQEQVLNGFVIPTIGRHAPGTVGYQGRRRSMA